VSDDDSQVYVSVCHYGAACSLPSTGSRDADAQIAELTRERDKAIAALRIAYRWTPWTAIPVDARAILRILRDPRLFEGSDDPG